MIDKFEMFIALAREKHFGRAAESCNISQPTLSSAIRSLEDHYGMPLVLRGARFMGLTPEGEKVLRRARNIVAESRAILSDLHENDAALVGELRIGVIPTALTLAHTIAAPILNKHPGLRLDIRAMRSKGLMEAMADFRIDLGIGYSHDDQGRPPSDGFESLSLFRESWAVLMRNDAAPAQILWEDLPNLRLGLLSADLQNRRILDRVLEARGVVVDPVVASSSTLALCSLLLEGGIDATVLPVHPAQFWERMPNLCSRALPQDSGLPTPDVALILPAEGRRNLFVQEFIKAAETSGFGL